MKRKQKLQRLLKVLTPDQVLPDFTVFDEQVNQLKTALKDKIIIKTLEDVSVVLEKFKKSLDLQPLLDSISSLKGSFDEKITALNSLLEKKALEMKTGDVDSLKAEVLDIQVQLSFLEDGQKKLKKSIPDLTDLENRVDEVTTQLSSRIDALEEEEPQEIKDWQNTIDKLRIELLGKMNSIGGGSMNRHINFNGTDFLTKYTDINYKAGSNVTFTIANNNQTKMVDVTISSSGGGGGSTRSINSISTSQTAGSTSGTDYVYICSGTMTLTMPDATASNTNLYTIKNVGVGIVTINTTSAQTIDGSLTIVMPVQYTSVDLISDTANWNVT